MTSPEFEAIPSCGKPHRLLCLDCGAERVWDHGPEGAICACGEIGLTASLDNMLDIRISLDELRLLTYNASDYARGLKLSGYDPEGLQLKAVQAVIDRLTFYTDAALTVSQMVADIQSKALQAHNLRNGEMPDE